MRARSLIYPALLALLIAAVYYTTFQWLIERYTSPDSYYSHGFIIPFITTYLLWGQRHVLLKEQWKYSPWGLIAIVCAFIIHIAAQAAGVYFVSGFSLLLLVFGLSLYLFGTAMTRRAAFPLGFLVFMLPLPLSVINSISFPLRIWATKMSVAVLQGAGMPVQSEGFRILFPNDSLVVGDPCSGLRSLIAMLAMGSIFAFLSCGGKGKKIMIVALAVPVALFSNVARLMVLCLGAFKFGSSTIQGFFHDATGYAAYIAAFAALWYAARRFHGPA